MSYWDASILLSFLVWSIILMFGPLQLIPILSSLIRIYELLDFQFQILQLVCSTIVLLAHCVSFTRSFITFTVLFILIHNPYHPFHSERPNLFRPRRATRGSLSINSLSFSPMRFHTSQYFRCFIPATTKLWNELPSIIVEVTELQKLKIGADAFFIGCGWTVVMLYVPQFFKYIYIFYSVHF